MVCCTVIAALFALLTRFLVVARPNPLAWRLSNRTHNGTISAGGRLKSIMHALNGLRLAARGEPNMRIHLGAATAVTAAGLWIGLSVAEWPWLVLAITLVLITEALNTAVEHTCNAVSPEFHPAIKAAKDVAAGAVLMSALAAALIGALVFMPHLVAALSDAFAVYCGDNR